MRHLKLRTQFLGPLCLWQCFKCLLKSPSWENASHIGCICLTFSIVIFQMSPQIAFMRTHLKTHSGEKSNKSNQYSYASSQERNLKTHLKTHSGEKSNKCNNVTLHPLMQALWRHIWKHTAEKRQTNATSVTMHPLRQVIWRHIWQHNVEKSQTKVIHGRC